MKNKIYNNLTIENLIKTKWGNRFNKKQQEQIKLGLKEKLDVSIYAKKKFNWQQMFIIREGLKNNLDVSVYTKTEFDSSQMG